MNQCPLVEACQSKSLVPLLPSVFAEFAGQELEESGILGSSSGIKLVKGRDFDSAFANIISKGLCN